jgi:hypothetical protein
MRPKLAMAPVLALLVGATLSFPAAAETRPELVRCHTEEAQFFMRESEVHKWIFLAFGRGGFYCDEKVTMLYGQAALTQNWGPSPGEEVRARARVPT